MYKYEIESSTNTFPARGLKAIFESLTSPQIHSLWLKRFTPYMKNTNKGIKDYRNSGRSSKLVAKKNDQGAWNIIEIDLPTHRDDDLNNFSSEHEYLKDKKAYYGCNAVFVAKERELFSDLTKDQALEIIGKYNQNAEIKNKQEFRPMSDAEKEMAKVLADKKLMTWARIK